MRRPVKIFAVLIVVPGARCSAFDGKACAKESRRGAIYVEVAKDAITSHSNGATTLSVHGLIDIEDE
jgi:hypothetical protein